MRSCHPRRNTARLKLEITDDTGQPPTYPVLVQLAVGGPRHGTLILDPDGHQVACSRAAFLWHEDVDHPNDQFGYTMGTYSAYVGVEPDPDNPPQVRPVWGTAEALNLAAQAKALVDGQPADPLLLSYGVHPQPGKPDHFLCLNPDLTPCPDTFTYWTAYGLYPNGQGITTAGPFPLMDAYFLKDTYGNTVFGFTNTSATWPGQGVETSLSAQTSGDSGGDFAGYTLTTTMYANPTMPQGTYHSTLSVAYPDDPAGDWLSGTVTKEITYDFQGGSSHTLVQKQNYEQRTSDQGQAVVDGVMPMAVAPGATSSSLATLPDGSTPRLVLLALTGSQIPASLLAPAWATVWGEDEPTLDPTHAWTKVGGEWQRAERFGLDAALDVTSQPSFRLSLVGDDGKVVPGTSFRVHRCPRAEHLSSPDVPPGDCTLGAVDSEKDGDLDTGVLSSITLNEPGGQRGYLGIELTKAPVAPGQYSINVESLGPTDFRIRRQSQLVTGGEGETGEYQGAFAICVVLGGEILDENFQRVDSIAVNEATPVFVRFVDPIQDGDDVALDVTSYFEGETPFEQLRGVSATRVGRSGVFLSEQFDLIPAWSLEEAGEQGVHALATGGQKRLPVPKDRKKAIARARKAASQLPLAWARTESGSVYKVPLGLTLRLDMYSVGPTSFGGKWYFVCSKDANDCPSTTIASGQVTWEAQPAGFDTEGDENQTFRMELEPGHSEERPNDPDAGWYLRAIRLTTKLDQSERVPGGQLILSGSPSDGVVWPQAVEIIKPSTLGCCDDEACPYACKTVYEPPPAQNPSAVVDLVPLIIAQADTWGIPPQYLLAQAASEASWIQGRAGFLNAYSFRYEPTSRDFKMAVGDHGTSANMGESDDKRHLYNPAEALFNLGIRSAGSVSYLPCEETTDDNNADGNPVLDLPSLPFSPNPCLVGEGVLPPNFENKTLVQQDEFGIQWRIPGLPEGAVLQLGVKVFTGDPPLPDVPFPAFVQVFDSEPADGYHYKVDPSTGTITFGGAWLPSLGLEAQYRLRPAKDAPPPSAPDNMLTLFGRSFSEGTQPEQLVTLIRQQNAQVPEPDRKMVPPADLHATLRAWRQQWTIDEPWNPFPTDNRMHRYYRDFTNTQLWKLMYNDPSFDIRGQWFASASYGIMQVIPETTRTNLATGFSATDREYIRQNVFDPLGEYPNVRNPELLFNPAVCIKLGAVEDVKANVSAELGPLVSADGHTETSCTSEEPTKCTWERWWKRRLRVYNGGLQASPEPPVWDYADRIIANSPNYMPQP